MRVIDTMNRTLLLIAASAAVVGIAGCGGGGGGNSGPAAPATNALRTLQTGDTWKYSVKADIVMANGSPTIHLKDGSYTRSIGIYSPIFVGDTPGGLSLTESLSLSYYGGYGVNANNVSHIFQQPDGVFQASDTQDIDGNEEYANPFDYTLFNFTGRQQILPVKFDNTTGFASDDAYGSPVFVPATPDTAGTNGVVIPGVPAHYIQKIVNHEHIALSVIGQEDIDTPVGKFSTWKCTVASHSVDTGIYVDGTEWWAPQTGTFVKADLTQNIPSVGTEHLHYVLQTMHLAPAPSAS